MKEEYLYQIVSEEKSSPVGIDWLMIMAAKAAIQRQLYFQRPAGQQSGLVRERKFENYPPNLL